MATILKVTVPVLEECIKHDSEFLLELSHAAAKEISSRYGGALLQSSIVKESLAKLEEAIIAAQLEAGRQLESKIGKWDNTYRTGYRLRNDVVKYIESNFSEIIATRFNKWLDSIDLSAKLDQLAKQYVEEKVEAVLKKQVGEFLRGR